MQDRTISKIAEEILEYKGKCPKIAVNNISKTLMNLDVPVRTYAVHDIGATEVETNSLTVVAITPVPESIIKPFAKKFQLYQ